MNKIKLSYNILYDIWCFLTGVIYADKDVNNIQVHHNCVSTCSNPFHSVFKPLKKKSLLTSASLLTLLIK